MWAFGRDTDSRIRRLTERDFRRFPYSRSCSQIALILYTVLPHNIETVSWRVWLGGWRGGCAWGPRVAADGDEDHRHDARPLPQSFVLRGHRRPPAATVPRWGHSLHHHPTGVPRHGLTYSSFSVSCHYIQGQFFVPKDTAPQSTMLF